MAVTFDETELVYVTGPADSRSVLTRVDIEPEGSPSTAFLLRLGPHDDDEAEVENAIALHLDYTHFEDGLPPRYEENHTLLDDASVSGGIWFPDPVTRVREPIHHLVDSALIVGTAPLGASRRGDSDSRWVYLVQEHGAPTPVKRLVAMRNELTRPSIERTWGSIHYTLRERPGYALTLTRETPRAAVIRREPMATPASTDPACLARIDLYALQRWLIHVSHHGGTE